MAHVCEHDLLKSLKKMMFFQRLSVFNGRDEAEHEDVPVARQDAEGLRGARRHHQGEDGRVSESPQAQERAICRRARGLQ